MYSVRVSPVLESKSFVHTFRGWWRGEELSRADRKTRGACVILHRLARGRGGGGCVGWYAVHVTEREGRAVCRSIHRAFHRSIAQSHPVAYLLSASSHQSGPCNAFNTITYEEWSTVRGRG